MLHMVSLTIDEAAEMEYHAAGLVALTHNGCIGVLKSRELFLVALAFAFELFGDLLLEYKRFESVVPLLFCTIDAGSKAGSIVLLLVDKRSEPAVLAFMGFDLDFEILSLLGELFGERLEFEEL